MVNPVSLPSQENQKIHLTNARAHGAVQNSTHRMSSHLVAYYLTCRSEYECLYFIYEIELPAIWWGLLDEIYVATHAVDSPWSCHGLDQQEIKTTTLKSCVAA